MKTIRLFVAALVVAALAGGARAEIKHKTVTYKSGGDTMEGYLAWDDSQTGKRPGILVVPEWWGLNDDAKKRADQLAALGYVAFAADMYGNAKVTDSPKEAGMLAGGIRKDAKKWEAHAKAALAVLEHDDKVDPQKLASIGYCFGGSTSMMLANVGAPIRAVVSFHGAPVPPTPEQAKGIKAKILILNGADDANIPPAKVEELKHAYEAGGVSVRAVNYPGARHSFTVAGADSRGLDNIRYNADADRESWAEMRKLFKDVFGQ
jgi:dienelactone hydrolase